MTEDFIKIADAKAALKGSFKATVIKVGDLKSGTKNEKDWTKKVFTLEDDTDNVELVAWDDEISTFKLGYLYEIVNPWWKVYEGKTSVQVGKYGTAKVIGSDKTIPDTPPMPKEQSTLTESTEKPAEPKRLDAITAQKVEEESMLLKKIHNNVQKTLGEDKPDVINLFTELIYKKYFNV